MKKYLILQALFFSLICYSQTSLSELLKTYNDESVAYITNNELALSNNKAVILDARELNEYKVSHLKNAIYVGYDYFDLEATTQRLKNKHEEIVVYCSLGVRSEDIAKQLKKAGYSNVKNLYGGIFEWKNNDLPVYNNHKKTTDSVHVFSKKWSKWLHKGVKVFSNQ